LVVVILAVMWVLVLVPPMLRSRHDGRPSSSISSFRRQLSTLGRTTPTVFARVPGRPAGGFHRAAPSPMPYRPGPSYGMRPAHRPSARGYSQRYAAKRRRQQVLLTLVGVAFFTAVLAFGMGVPAMLWLNLLVDAALVGYVVLLVKLRQVEQARAMRAQWYRAA